MEDGVDSLRARLEVRERPRRGLRRTRSCSLAPNSHALPLNALSSFQAALHLAATAPAATPPLAALLTTLTSTCPTLVGEGPALVLPTTASRAVFDAALRRALVSVAADAAGAGVPLMEHAPAGGGGAPAIPRLLDLAVDLGGSGAVDQGEREESGRRWALPPVKTCPHFTPLSIPHKQPRAWLP